MGGEGGATGEAVPGPLTHPQGCRHLPLLLGQPLPLVLPCDGLGEGGMEIIHSKYVKFLRPWIILVHSGKEQTEYAWPRC